MASSNHENNAMMEIRPTGMDVQICVKSNRDDLVSTNHHNVHKTKLHHQTKQQEHSMHGYSSHHSIPIRHLSMVWYM